MGQSAEDSVVGFSVRSLQQASQELGVPVPAEITRLLASSSRVVTRLGSSDKSDGWGNAADSGEMVWHGWQPAPNVSPRKRPLLMFHGGSGSWTHWLRVIEPLTQAGYTLWLADLPGFGESDGVPGGVDVDTMLAPLAHSIAQLLAQTGSGTVCDLAGFSFGGMTAGLLAAEFPALIGSLVIVGAPGMGLTEGKVVRLKGWRHLATPEAQMQAHRYNLAALMLHDLRLIDEETLALHALNVARDRLPRRRLSQTNILALALGRIKAPVAAIYGEHDPLYVGRLDELHGAMQQAYAGGELRWQVIAGAGHWVQHERPAELSQALVTALSAMDAVE